MDHRRYSRPKGIGLLMVRAAGLILALAMSAFSPTRAAASEVQLAADAASVASCERLGEVRGSSLFGGAMTNFAYGRALASVKAKAGALGATHLLLLNVASGFAGSNMVGVAYRCTPPHPQVDKQ
jgi:hypothetical protein